MIASLQHGGLDRPYTLHPPSDPGARPAPLLVQLHGRGGGGPWFDQMTGFGPLCARAGWTLAIPDAVNRVWNDGRLVPGSVSTEIDDVGYLSSVIDDASRRASVDPDRIFIVGMSNGAAMAGRLAVERADLVAAIAQVSGTASSATASRRPVRPVAVLSFHGTADRLARYEGGLARTARARILIRGSRATSVGVDDWAGFWVGVNGAQPRPVVDSIPPDVTVRSWPGPTPGSDVVFYRIEGGGHTWPGSRWTVPQFLLGRVSRTIDASEIIWTFFQNQGRRGSAVPDAVPRTLPSTVPGEVPGVVPSTSPSVVPSVGS